MFQQAFLNLSESLTGLFGRSCGTNRSCRYSRYKSVRLSHRIVTRNRVQRALSGGENQFVDRKFSIVSIVSQTFLRSCFISCLVFRLSKFTAAFWGRKNSPASLPVRPENGFAPRPPHFTPCLLDGIYISEYTYN